jgi:hypothetical protein
MANFLGPRVSRISRSIPLLPSVPIRHVFNSYPAKRHLNDILKLELVLLENEDKIKSLWFSYHNVKPGIVPSSLSSKEYNLLEQRHKKCTLNIYPIYRNRGFFLLLSQYQDANHTVFCNFEDFKKDPHTAMPWMVVTLYTELAKSKNLILLRADITNRNLKKEEAIRVLKLWKLMYLDPSGDFYAHVEKLNLNPSEFSMERFLKQLPENLDEVKQSTCLTSHSIIFLIT